MTSIVGTVQNEKEERTHDEMKEEHTLRFLSAINTDDFSLFDLRGCVEVFPNVRSFRSHGFRKLLKEGQFLLVSSARLEEFIRQEGRYDIQ